MASILDGGCFAIRGVRGSQIIPGFTYDLSPKPLVTAGLYGTHSPQSEWMQGPMYKRGLEFTNYILPCRNDMQLNEHNIYCPVFPQRKP